MLAAGPEIEVRAAPECPTCGSTFARFRKMALLGCPDCYQALQVKFAYALTCHKSQGGQWPAVIVDQGYMTEDRMDLEWLRWLYTAVTRAETDLHLLNFSDAFFE